MNAAQLAPAVVDHLADTELTHFYCECDPDSALCGLDLTGADESEGNYCVVCDDLADMPCERCGAP